MRRVIAKQVIRKAQCPCRRARRLPRRLSGLSAPSPCASRLASPPWQAVRLPSAAAGGADQPRPQSTVLTVPSRMRAKPSRPSTCAISWQKRRREPSGAFFCLGQSRLPHTSISHQRWRLFLVRRLTGSLVKLPRAEDPGELSASKQLPPRPR